MSVSLSKPGSMGYQQRFLTALYDLHFRYVLVTLEKGCSQEFLVALCSESSVSFSENFAITQLSEVRTHVSVAPHEVGFH